MSNKVNFNDKNIDELKGLLLEYKKELFNLRFQKVVGELLNTSRLRTVRRDIARIKTCLNKKNIAEG